MKDIITRLNCSNCKFYSLTNTVDIGPEELNKQGGIKNSSDEEKSRAQSIKLITLPGKMKVTSKHWCNESSVEQWVTEHMWCRNWDATGTIHVEK